MNVIIVDKGYLMINNFENTSVMLEIEQLVNNIENVKNEVDVYCDLMKQLFLSKSNCN